MNQGTLGTISVDLILSDAKFKQGLDTAVREAASASEKISASQAVATERVSSRFATLGGAVTKSFLATGVAAAAAGVASIKMSGDFEQSLNVFRSVSGATAEQMGLVAAKARELGNDASLPGISARDAAQALTELAKAGLTVNQSLAASKGVLSLAKAGNLEVADAAQIAARALTSFGLSGDKATQVADVLAAAANASTASVQDMALGLAQVGSGAQQMGVSLQDTVTALALFANAGIEGQDAGTSLKQMFLQLAAPSKQASDQMRELGLNFFDAKGNFVGLGSAAGQLHDKLSKLTVEQRNAALAIIFGSDAARVAGVLANNGAQGFESMAKSVSKAGAATQLAAAQNSGFNGALDNLISTLQTIGIDIGVKVLPPLTRFLQSLAGTLPAAVDLVSSHFGLLVAAVSGLGAAFLAVKVGAVVQGFIALIGAVRGAAVGVGVLSAAMDANPIGLIALAVGALVAALVFLQVKFNIFGVAFAALKPIIDPVVGALRETGQILSGLLAPVFALVAANADALTKAFITLVAVALVPLVVSLGPVIAGIAAVIAVILALPTVLRATISVFQAFGTVISSVFGVIAQVYAATLKPVFDAIAVVVRALFTIWLTVFTAILTVTVTILSTIAQIVSVILLGVGRFIFNTFLKPLIDVWTSVFNTLSRVVSSALGGVAGAVSAPLNQALGFVRGIVGQFSRAGGDLISGLVAGVQGGAGAVVNKVKEICASALQAVKSFFGIHSPSTVMAQMGGFLMQGFAQGIARNSGLAEGAVQDMSQRVSDALGNSAAVSLSGNVGVGGAAGGKGAGNVTFNQTNVIQGTTDLDLVNRQLLWDFRNA